MRKGSEAMRLNEKVAIITGGGRGIGFAAASAFAEEGAKVVLADIDAELGRQAEKALRAEGADATFVETDVSRSEDVQRLVARTRELHARLDVLYNNASVFLGKADGAVTDLAEETWDRVLGVNLRGVFLCCKYAVPLIVESGGGSVINTSSSAGVMGIPGCDAYTATKGATIALTRSMAVEFGPQKVRVNCIAPAGVDTEMLRESSLDDPAFDESGFLRKAPLGRYGSPREIANLAVFLASDESSYVTGAILRADGGITITPIS
jgi:NAD(P)-dependent dehydrogenase (short-subunit alcohol dehydrogenase family)